ncbi:MAG: Asp-tRNA(Asn)/Glu-tRNA(Gln) amidotransferase GatCAB subunit A, partial [Chloroflexi bacterium]|nr:Asp-tRNA(Asn)/Glu-tRNA(Gln) amidotransferase GatCAB subunit A [Chloroflexota bacterium]
SLEYAGAAQQTIMLSEAFTYHRTNLLARPEDFGEMVRGRFRLGGLVSSADYVQAQRVRNVIKREFADVLKTVDVIATPTMSIPPPSFATASSRNTSRLRSLTGPYNLTGMPAISIPCGLTPDGLPVGFQIAGKPFDEPAVFQVAYAYQQKVRMYERRPPNLD